MLVVDDEVKRVIALLNKHVLVKKNIFLFFPFYLFIYYFFNLFFIIYPLLIYLLFYLFIRYDGFEASINERWKREKD